jgi:hypothetical protein
MGSITKHGNPRLRRLMVELAWRVSRFQPRYREVCRWAPLLHNPKASVAARKKAMIARLSPSMRSQSRGLDFIFCSLSRRLRIASRRGQGMDGSEALWRARGRTSKLVAPLGTAMPVTRQKIEMSLCHFDK